MNESSRLYPASMRAQSDAAIAALRADNDALEATGRALDAFINDDTNRSRAFENLRRKMRDFRAVADALIKANDSDIADHRRLAHLVGSRDLDGSVIIPQLESNLRSRITAEGMIAHYAGVLSDVSLLQRLNPFDRTYSNALRSKQRWESYLRTVNAIIARLEGKVRSYNEIERATRELLTSGGGLRSAAARGLEHIREAAAGLPGSYDSEGLGAWRNDITIIKESLSQTPFDGFIQKDENGDIIEVDWDALGQQDSGFIESFLKYFFLDVGVNSAIASPIGQGLVELINNFRFAINDSTWKLLGFEVTPNGLAKAVGNGIVVIGAGITFVNELQSGENIVNATLYTAGNAGVAWGAKATSAAVGKAVGTAATAALWAKKGAVIGTLIPIPFLGTAAGIVVGATVGALVGTIGTGLFSNIYNNHVREHVDSFVDSAREAFNNIGQGVRGFFSNLGSAFGG